MAKSLSEIEAALAAPLPRSAVKEREGSGGMTLSYVDQHYVISKAIEIFGPMGFSCETMECKACSVDTATNRAGKSVHVLGYMATVRVHVGDTFKDGTGFGSGRDADLGRAHESAMKEAETDAMKRAFRLFGNTMGLALYDKEQAGVAEEDTLKSKPSAPKANFAQLMADVQSATGESLKGLKASVLAFRDSPEEYKSLVDAARARQKELKETANG